MAQVDEKGDHMPPVTRQITFTSRVSISPSPPTQPDGADGDLHPSIEQTSTCTSEDLQGFTRLDPSKTVLLRFECTSAKELKVCLSKMVYESVSDAILDYFASLARCVVQEAILASLLLLGSHLFCALCSLS